MAIKFTNDKVDRWLERIGKRIGKLTPEETQDYNTLVSIRSQGEKLDSHWEKILLGLERKV